MLDTHFFHCVTAQLRSVQLQTKNKQKPERNAEKKGLFTCCERLKWIVYSANTLEILVWTRREVFGCCCVKIPIWFRLENSPLIIKDWSYSFIILLLLVTKQNNDSFRRIYSSCVKIVCWGGYRSHENLFLQYNFIYRW